LNERWSQNNLDRQGPKPKPITHPQCSRLLKHKLRNQYLIFLLKGMMMKLIHML